MSISSVFRATLLHVEQLTHALWRLCMARYQWWRSEEDNYQTYSPFDYTLMGIAICLAMLGRRVLGNKFLKSELYCYYYSDMHFNLIGGALELLGRRG